MRTKCPLRLMTMVFLAAVILLTSQAIAGQNASELSGQIRSLGLSKSVPGQLNYQGCLADAVDSSAVNSTLEMTFRLYDSESKGAELWSEIHPAVEVQGGLFQVLLGSITAFPGGLFGSSELWLQTEVGPEVLAPRKLLVSVAYSQMSENADHAATADWATDTQHAVHADTADVCPGLSAWIVDGDNVYRTVGQVGIGTDSPSFTLDVDGTVGATSFYGDGSNLTGISGSADADWTISGDTVYHAVGPVGIGTASPDERLTMYYNSYIGWEYSGTNSIVAHKIGKSSSGAGPLEFVTTHNPGPAGKVFTFRSGAGEIMSMLHNGEVGIGTDSPAYKLDVNGDVNATTYYGDGSNLTGISGTADADWTINGDTVYHEIGPVGIGTTTPTAPLTIQTISGNEIFFPSTGTNADISAAASLNVGTSTGLSLNLMNNSQYRLSVNGAGDVGIGTISPAHKLDVNGDVNATTYYGDGSNLTGISGTTDADWTIAGSDMYSAVSGDVGIGTSGPGAKLEVVGSSGAYAQLGRSDRAVYGVFPGANSGELGGSYGVYGLDISSGNYGYLGGSSYGLYARHNSSGNIGYVGGGPYAAHFEHSASGNFCNIGSSEEAVFGKHGDTENYGQLGTFSWGAYGNHADSSNHGCLGGGAYGAYGYNNHGNYGALGTKDYGVYYSGGISGTGKGGLIVRTEDGPKEVCFHQATESWCEDFGSGQVIGGRAKIQLADDFQQTVTVSVTYPLKVFITPNQRIGEWWVEKGASGFALVAPDAPDGALFDYRVVAKRLGHEDDRLMAAPAGYGDHFLYPDIADVPLEHRARWRSSAQYSGTDQ
jgi:hypothetical protein